MKITEHEISGYDRNLPRVDLNGLCGKIGMGIEKIKIRAIAAIKTVDNWLNEEIDLRSSGTFQAHE